MLSPHAGRAKAAPCRRINLCLAPPQQLRATPLRSAALKRPACPSMVLVQAAEVKRHGSGDDQLKPPIGSRQPCAAAGEAKNAAHAVASPASPIQDGRRAGSPPRSDASNPAVPRFLECVCCSRRDFTRRVSAARAAESAVSPPTPALPYCARMPAASNPSSQPSCPACGRCRCSTQL